MTKRRGNGEGTVYKRKDGRWEGRYTVQTPSGPKRRTLYGRTRQEAAARLTKALAAADGTLVFDDEDLTVGEYLKRWINDSVRGDVGHRTYHSYLYHVENHISPALGRTKLKNLSPMQIQALYRSKLDGGYAPSTVRYTHAVLRRALKQALRWGLVPRNAAEAVDPPKVRREEVMALSPDQIRTLLRAASGERFEALYVLAVYSGLRQGELLALRWSDVDLASGKLRVSRQLQRTRDRRGLVFTQLKNGKMRRTIRVGGAAVEALRAHRARQAEEKLKAGPHYRDEDLIFATYAGTPLNASNVAYRSLKPLLERAGLPPVRFHDLRHACATLLLSAAVPPKVVQERLGHANIAMTMDVYSHVMPDLQESAAAALEAALR